MRVRGLTNTPLNSSPARSRDAHTRHWVWTCPMAYGNAATLQLLSISSLLIQVTAVRLDG